MAGFALPMFLQSPVCAETEKNMKEEKSRTEKLLSSHQTEARFDGIQFIPCRFMTSLCPDKCGHAKNVAVFTISKYIDYKKTGKYGDEQQTVFFVDVSSPINGNSFASKIRQAIAHLKEGNTVRLDWNHIYVTEGGSSFPERPVTKLETLEIKEK